jgi:hypothetical protein
VDEVLQQTGLISEVSSVDFTPYLEPSSNYRASSNLATGLLFVFLDDGEKQRGWLIQLRK